MPSDAHRSGHVKLARRKLEEQGPARERAQGDFDRVTLPNADGNVLRDLLSAAQARTMIEIGLAYGSSALAIAEALLSADAPHPQHLIIDAYQDHYYDVGWDLLVKANLDGICSLRRERSQLVLPRLVGEGFVADAAFVDGSHIFHNVFVDLYYVREIVRPNDLVILDDCQWPSVATAVRYFELNTGWEPLHLSCQTRLRAYRLPDPPTEPSFRDFTPF